MTNSEKYTNFALSEPPLGESAKKLRYDPNGMRYLLYHSNGTLERQHGLGWYDNRARVRDALTGRFTTPDPLAERYPDQSPYAHCANNPVRNIDPTGMDIWMIDERGSIQSYEKTMDFDAVRIVDGQGNTMIGKDGSTRVWIIHKI